MTRHDQPPPQWPPTTATDAYLAAYERTRPARVAGAQQVREQLCREGREVLDADEVGIVLLGPSRAAERRLHSAGDFAPELARADVGPVSALLEDRGLRLAHDCDDVWDVVRSWPGLGGGAIPMVVLR